MDLQSLTKKRGPLPTWAWALIASIILYLLYRHFKGSSTASATTATDTTSTDTTGNVASIPSVTDTGGVGFSPPDTLPNTDVSQSSVTPWWMDPTITGQDPTNPTDTTNSPVPPLSSPPITTGPQGVRNLDPKPAAKPVTHPPLKSIIPGIKGKIISQKVLPSGAKLVTLAGGRQIEQAKGKKAYVVRK